MGDASADAGAVTADAATDAPSSTSVAIAFVAQVGDVPFPCSQTYPGLGTVLTTIAPLDMSGPTDPECPAIFRNLRISLSDRTPDPALQTSFRVK